MGRTDIYLQSDAPDPAPDPALAAVVACRPELADAAAADLALRMSA